MRVIDRRQRDLLPRDVMPDVQLGPVRQREHPDRLTRMMPPVVQRPQLRTLILRIPLPELIPEREHPLLGPSLLLIPARTTEQRIKPILVHRIQQHRSLNPIPRTTSGLGYQSTRDGLRHAGHDQLQPELVDPPVPILHDLGEVVAGVDVHHRERDPPRRERLLRQPQHHDRVLAAREQQHRALELGDHLPHHEHALRFERVEMRYLERRH